MAININHQTDTIEASGGTLNLPDFAGGGGLTHFVESEETASPNATVPVDALTATDASYTNIDVALVAKGTGATLAQVPDGTATGGNKRGLRATDLQKSRSSATHVASGNYSVIAGGESNTATALYSTVGGGTANRTSTNYSTVSGGSSNVAQTNTFAAIVGGSANSATGQYSFVGGGQSNGAGATQSFVGGGYSNSTTGPYTSILGGYDNSAQNSYSAVLGGYFNLANGQSSTVVGGSCGSTRLIAGFVALPASDAPITAVRGVSQSGLLVLGRETTDATATVLASNSSAAGSTNQVILPNNSAYSFTGEVIAGVTAAGDTARWTIDGAIKRGANAASTAMVGTPTVTMTHNDAGAAAWTVAVTANTTNGGIKVEVTGAAATTIRWVCKINTTEMTY